MCRLVGAAGRGAAVMTWQRRMRSWMHLEAPEESHRAAVGKTKSE